MNEIYIKKKYLKRKAIKNISYITLFHNTSSVLNKKIRRYCRNLYKSILTYNSSIRGLNVKFFKKEYNNYINEFGGDW